MTTVLHVVASANRRGAEVFATDLDDALRANGWTSSVVALQPAAKTPALDVETLATGHWIRAIAGLRARIHDVDIVIAHGSFTLSACVLASAGSTTPVVYRSIGDPEFWSGSGVRRARTNLMLRRSAAVVCLWEDARRHLVARGLDPGRVRVIPNAIDMQVFRPRTQASRLAARETFSVDPTSSLAVYLGAYSSEKAPEVAVRAALQLPDLHLRMAGSGPMRAQLESEAAAASDRIIVGDPTDEPALLLSAADVLVIPSRTEGIPGVLLEAAAIGVPVVAASVGGIPDVMATGITGVLTEPADATSLAAGITQVLETTQEQPCVPLDDRYSLASVCAAWSHCLEETLMSRQPV